MSFSYPGGIISGTENVPSTSPPYCSGVWKLSEAAYWVAQGVWPYGPSDPNFENVTLLLNGDGTNGTQNNTFLDSSANNFTITRNGNTTQGSFSPYGSNWGNYFDGTGDFLQLVDDVAFDLSGDYTVECYFFITSTPSSPTLIQLGSSSNFLILYLASASRFISTAGSLSITSSIAINLNSWNHVALVRSGAGTNNTVMYINGAVAGQATDTTSFTGSASNGVRIGAEFPTDFLVNGYISNVRIVNGTAVYTSAFTPSTTPLTAVTNTVLLTCQSNRFIDNSTNNFTVTRNGDVSVQRFSPFNPTEPYSTSVIGGSGYFDGSGDYLTLANDAAFQFGSGDFTIDGWFYSTSSGDQAVMSRWSSPDSNSAWEIIRVSGTTYFQVASSSSAISVTTSDFPLNQWNHFAMSKSSTTMAAWLNGTRIGTNTVSGSVNNGDQGLSIGVRSGGTSYPFAGYLANLRVVKGTDVYGVSNTTITVPTAPTTAITNTSLLSNMTNAGIPDLAMQNNLETVADAQVSTSEKKYGTGSLAFDGTGDLLFASANPQYAFDSGAYTVEFWLYKDSTGSGERGILQMQTASLFGLSIFADGTALYVDERKNAFDGADPRITATITQDAWNHIAVCREGGTSGTLRAFVNGTQSGSSVTSNLRSLTSIGPLYVGNNTVAANSFKGNIDDLRITKGLARYTTTFTPPASALPTY
jgi:hypothetical protein